jgi:cobalt/nickel transport system permease protein
MQALDACAHTNRWCRRDPLEKLALGGGLLVLSLLLPPWPAGPLIATVMMAAALAGARVPPRLYLRTVCVPAGFALAGVVTMLVSVSFDGGGLRLQPAPGGVLLAARVLLRCGASVSCLVFLALTTPLVDLVPTLRRLGCPLVVSELMLLIYRLLFVLSETLAAMTRAQAARLGFVDRRACWRSTGLGVAALLTRALSLARRLDIGLQARGFSGDLRVVDSRPPVDRRARAGIALLLAAVTAVSLLGAWRWPWPT